MEMARGTAKQARPSAHLGKLIAAAADRGLLGSLVGLEQGGWKDGGREHGEGGSW